jgi:ribosomal protein L20A (L18A)
VRTAAHGSCFAAQRYDSRSGTHNMYKEVRDTTLNNAIEKICELGPLKGRAGATHKRARD